jgi:hypothetical protein
VEAAEANAAVVYGPGGGAAVIGLTGNPAGRMYLTTTTGGLAAGSAYQMTPVTQDFLKGGVTLSAGAALVVPTAGEYLIAAQVFVNASGVGQYEIQVFKNGVLFDTATVDSTGVTSVTPAYAQIRTLAANDAISFYAGIYGSNATSVKGSNTALSIALMSK